MSDPYTPTTEDIRKAYIEDEFGIPRETHLIPEFERWLAAYEATLRAQIASEIRAHRYDDPQDPSDQLYDIALNHAARIARGKD